MARASQIKFKINKRARLKTLSPEDMFKVSSGSLGCVDGDFDNLDEFEAIVVARVKDRGTW